MTFQKIPKMRTSTRTRKFVISLLITICLTSLYLKLSSNDSVSYLVVEKRIADTLSNIAGIQRQEKVTLVKTQDEIDAEIIEQVNKGISDAKLNATDADIRSLFDAMPPWEASKRDHGGHPHFNGFLIENSQICSNSSIDILIYIQSSISHRDKREIIRKTWGNKRQFHDISIEIVFILGASSEIKNQTAIDMENSIHADIVQGNFNDTFSNLHYKAITALTWINMHCPQAKTIMKTDDDIFVDIFRVVKEFIPRLIENKNGRHLMCDHMLNSEIIRDPLNKWYVPQQYLPSSTKWPPFCSGYFILMSGDLIPLLYDQSFTKDDFIFIDDAYVFGILLNKIINVTVSNAHNQTSFIQRPSPSQEIQTKGKFEFLVFEMPRESEDLWELKLQQLTEWERSHSMFVKLFGDTKKKTVLIE